MPAARVEQWLAEKSQAINQVELHPVTVALKIWKGALADRDVIFWIDNEAARFGLIRGSSPVPVSQELVSEAWARISAMAAFPWFERVPSVGNPIDGPSRGDNTLMAALGFSEVKAPAGYAVGI